MKNSILKYRKDKSTTWYLSKAARIVLRHYGEKLHILGISPSQSGLLYALYQAKTYGEQLTQNDLGKILFLNKIGVHKLIVGLEKLGFIQRNCNTADSRCKIVSLSERGHQLIPKIEQVDQEIEGYLLTHLAKFHGAASAQQNLATHLQQLLSLDD